MRELLDPLSSRALPASTPNNALSHTILALGSHALASENPPDKRSELLRHAQAHFRASCRCKSKIHEGEFSVRDFQVSEPERSIVFTHTWLGRLTQALYSRHLSSWYEFPEHSSA